jgi:hypothetical protein
LCEAAGGTLEPDFLFVPQDRRPGELEQEGHAVWPPR